ncbi:MarR family winged helix-turn-helix transcriptional regulator [Roseicyclus mahoneyensis]|jgi:DNA-binding MarR family transcriptional regulator|uniref:DNA-binding MarR family transcriptional regulator n=1 Tax=Roseicyclus mahoneyensis TaxID=164332 RepID=A0A316GL74_9RHOB|nr:MarR family winged helix-turn-helix transcriptional regulator [Roseicyclus mahoneyensis]PWK61643.1 DNA-binding MarR family transcriptional regulator [Roseicyclus mahoneyensis]
MPDPFVLDGFLPYRVAVTAGRLSREFSRVYQERFGLSRAEWRVMAHLSQEAEVSVREIHARVDMDKSKVSRAATRLEEAGIITKRISDSDRRLVVLGLTDKGAVMMAELAEAAVAYHAQLIVRLGPGATAFLAGLEALGDADGTQRHAGHTGADQGQ